MKQKLLKRLANKLAERMTMEKNYDEWSNYLKSWMNFLDNVSVNVSRWYIDEKTGRYHVLLDDLLTNDSAWSD